MIIAKALSEKISEHKPDLYGLCQREYPYGLKAVMHIDDIVDPPREIRLRCKVAQKPSMHLRIVKQFC